KDLIDLAFTKIAKVEGDKDVAELGDKITYTFTIENTGNVDLTNLSINDPMDGLDYDGATTGINLAAGEIYRVTATYKVTQEDVEVSKVSNQATVSGEDPDDNDIPETPSTDDPDNPGEPGDDPDTPTEVPTEGTPDLTF